MNGRTFALFCISLWFAGCATTPSRPKVRVTLNDGQILVGEMTTRTFALETGIGDLAFDTAHAGELGPLEGEDMHQSGRTVRLWLRNGSEFVGAWKKADVQVALSMGGKAYNVAVPIEKAKRLQFFGEAVWDERPVFRILTRSGDDFFVDVTKTQVLFSTELGTFQPFLSEVENLVALDRKKNKWRVHFENGTVFHATIGQENLDLRLDMGPERFALALASVERMERQTLRPAHPPSSGIFFNTDSDGDVRARTECGYYSNAEQKAAKITASKKWQKKE